MFLSFLVFCFLQSVALLMYGDFVMSQFFLPGIMRVKAQITFMICLMIMADLVFLISKALIL